jgi:Omp85 superfamily domain
LKTRLIFTLLLFLAVNNNYLFAQEEEELPDTIGVGGVNWFAYPFIFYTPETSLAFGAGGVLSFKFSNRRGLKPSNITGSGYYSINNQYDFTLIPEVYFNEDKFKVWFKFNYGKIFDRFYGVGSSTPNIDNNKYFQQNFIFNLKLLTEVFDEELKLGAIYEYRYMSVADKLGNPLLESGQLPGSEGGTTSGFGFVTTFDSRDNIFYPHSGGYYEFSITSFQKKIGSDFNYNKYVFDFRRFFELTQRHILALQVYMMIETAAPPFYDLALLGGDKLMRGYINGRYRDRNYYMLQAEYRMPLVWRFRLVFFGGVGDVSENLSTFTISTIKPTYGAGVRFRLDELEKLDLRLDVGFGKVSHGFYFSINQAF